MIVNKYANGGGGSTSGVTPQDVQQQINSALTPYWESGETKDYVDSAVSGISLDGYYTSAQTQEAIAEAVEGYATSGDMQSAFTLISETQQVAAAGFNQLEGRIDELSGNTPDMSAYWTSAQTKNYVDDKVVSAETKVGQTFANLDANVIQPMQGDIRELSGITEEIHDNFSAYTPTTGFSTINGSAITNGGNIVISGPDVSNYVTSAQVETQIVEKNYVTSAQVETQMVAKNYITSADTANFVTSAQVETQIVEKNYVNSGDVKSQVEAYNYATVSQIPTVPTSNTAFTNDAGYITDAAIENLVTSAQVETQIDTKAAAYTPTSGFSTINGSAITNGGNIVIEGGADMSAYYTSTQTDAAIAQAVSGLATEQYVQDALSGVNMDNYYTSAQTEEAISAATSGKADAANVSGNTSDRYFPAWNEQGIITGITDTVPVRTGYLGINGTGFTIYSRNISLGNIYGPQSAGTAGDILVSTGKGAPVWSAVTMPDMAAYTPTSGFSTINGSAITNGGNIVIEGGADMSAYYTSAQTEDAITSKNYITSAQVETQIVSKNYITSAEIADFVTSAQVETQITSKGYATVSQIPTVPTSNTAFTNDAGYITSEAIANMVTSTYVSTIWRGTQSDYDAIVDKDPNTFYIIVSN